jgi:hypothetical protein
VSPAKRAPLVSRLAAGGVQAVRARGPIGRHRGLLPTQLDQVEHALRKGAGAHRFASNRWTLERVAEVIWRLMGAPPSGAGVADPHRPVGLELATPAPQSR